MNQKKIYRKEIFELLGINTQEKTDNNKIKNPQKLSSIKNISKIYNNDKSITNYKIKKNENAKKVKSKQNDDHLSNTKNKILIKNKEINFKENLIEKNNDNNMKKGLPNKAYFIEKYQNNVGYIYNINDFNLQDVKADGNCGYRCISLQIYGEEENYYIIREYIYKCLHINKNNYKNIPLELDGKIINSEDYIEKVKKNKFWIGDLEISLIHKIKLIYIMVKLKVIQLIKKLKILFQKIQFQRRHQIIIILQIQ